MKQFYPIFALGVCLAALWYYVNHFQVGQGERISDMPTTRRTTASRSTGNYRSSSSRNNSSTRTASRNPSASKFSWQDWFGGTSRNSGVRSRSTSGGLRNSTARPRSSGSRYDDSDRYEDDDNPSFDWDEDSQQDYRLARGGRNRSRTPASNASVTRRPANQEFITIASFNIQILGEKKLDDRRAMQAIVDIIRQFDIVAIQEIRASDRSFMKRFMEEINARGGEQYECLVGGREGRSKSREQYAFVFSSQTIETDRKAAYQVYDETRTMERPPFVGWFRTKRAPPDEAFTFNLVNVHVDPNNTAREADLLAEAFRHVREDGRNEDDVILLGDFNLDDKHLGRIADIPNMFAVIENRATNTRGNRQYDNILFDRMWTSEYLGEGGVFDFMKRFNLSEVSALKISDHLPVYARFSIYEERQVGVSRNSSRIYW